MNTTLCGHKREALIWVLDQLARYPFENVKLVAKSMGDDFAVAVRDADDPAKLAELMAEELRRRGIDAAIRDNLGMPKDVELIPLPNKWCPGGEPAVGVSIRKGRGEADLDIPKARAALLRLMQLPECTPAQDVLKALEVGT